jgi:hypothetical protein
MAPTCGILLHLRDGTWVAGCTCIRCSMHLNLTACKKNATYIELLATCANKPREHEHRIRHTHTDTHRHTHTHTDRHRYIYRHRQRHTHTHTCAAMPCWDCYVMKLAKCGKCLDSIGIKTYMSLEAGPGRSRRSPCEPARKSEHVMLSTYPLIPLMCPLLLSESSLRPLTNVPEHS